MNKLEKLLEIAKWTARFFCEDTCLNRGGDELCMPCQAREILDECMAVTKS